MPITNGLVTIGTSPTVICASNQAVLLQNLSTTIVVTIGGASVTAGHGPALPFNASAPPPQPTLVPDLGGPIQSGLAVGDPIYGIVAAGSAAVAFLTATWDG